MAFLCLYNIHISSRLLSAQFDLYAIFISVLGYSLLNLIYTIFTSVTVAGHCLLNLIWSGTPSERIFSWTTVVVIQERENKHILEVGTECLCNIRTICLILRSQ